MIKHGKTGGAQCGARDLRKNRPTAPLSEASLSSAGPLQVTAHQYFDSGFDMLRQFRPALDHKHQVGYIFRLISNLQVAGSNPFWRTTFLNRCNTATAVGCPGKHFLKL